MERRLVFRAVVLAAVAAHLASCGSKAPKTATSDMTSEAVQSIVDALDGSSEQGGEDTRRELRQPQQTRLEPLRPQFHFSPQSGWMNDPNGLVYVEGTWHLFFQHYPDLPVWGPMHWGHATSPDGLRWTQQAIALAPDDRLGMAFSGCALVDWENRSGLGISDRPPVIALLTHSGGKDGTQKQSLAFSTDAAQSFSLYPDNPVIPNPGVRAFRDPKVFFHEASNRFVMVLAVGDRVQFYGSQDLLQWSLLSDFGEGQGSHGGVWECPDLFLLASEDDAVSKWVLQVGVAKGAPQGGSGTQYFLGDFDGTAFVSDDPPNTVRWLDYGADFYAFQTWSDAPEGKTIGLGWMSNWDYGMKTPMGDWRGVMSIPRELSLFFENGKAVVSQQPLSTLENLRQEVLFEGEGLDVEQDMHVVGGRELDIEGTLTPGDSGRCGIRVLVGEGAFTEIGFDSTTSTLYLDRTQSGNVSFDADFPVLHEAPVALVNGKLVLRVLVDRTTVEVFAQDGRVVLSDRVFPPEAAAGLTLFSAGGAALFDRFKVYRMASVWP
jgi:fructan beta-fructosidase